MKRRIIVVGVGVAAAIPTVALAAKDKERDEVRRATDQVLATVYTVQPEARRAVQSAAGYAAFSNVSGIGKGVAVNNWTKAVTYMRMATVHGGVGLGAKKFQLVWVFERPDALHRFVNLGWEIGSQATASAPARGSGAAYKGAVSVSQGVWLYQVTGPFSLAHELSARGTKYYRDSELN